MTETAVAAPRPRQWLPFLVALDTVLVAAVLVVAMVVTRPAAPAAPGTATSPGSTATGVAAPGPTPVPSASPGPPRFRLPSGNIACDMEVGGVTCTIASITFEPPAVQGCTGTVGHTVRLSPDGVAAPCVEGPRPGVAGQDVPVLFYGAATTVGDYTCTSATDGVTCTDAEGTGFRLARASLTLLR